MATAKKSTPALPADIADRWATADVLDGVDLIDKTKLVGVEFLITGAKFSVNARDITMVWVEGMFRSGETFTFNDSSTGVLAQMSGYVKSALNGVTPDLDVWTDLNVRAPHGLRVSTYEITDERGKKREASTYYLTTSGQRS